MSHEPPLPDVLDDLAHAHEGGRASDPDRVAEALESMVLHPEYPCLGARSVFNRSRAGLEVLEELGTEESARTLRARLARFAADTDLDEGFASLLAVFRATDVRDEAHFEQLLWRQLELLHELDDQPWDPQVSSDPGDPHFAFSVAGTAYFVVGLHPQASRIARRAPLPTLVFNLHEQFEQLRASDRYERMRDTIRTRDVALQGTLNPMVADHGRGSEAAQYSGRAVPADWAPPALGGQEATA